MDCFEVTGGARLAGRVRVTGAKNSALKLMAVALLAPGRTTIDEVPDILDVSIMSEVLRRLGCGVTYTPTPGSGGGGRVVVDVPERPSTETDYDLVRRMRASINVLGPLVARCGSARVALPGGDAIAGLDGDLGDAAALRKGQVDAVARGDGAGQVHVEHQRAFLHLHEFDGNRVRRRGRLTRGRFTGGGRRGLGRRGQGEREKQGEKGTHRTAQRGKDRSSLI